MTITETEPNVELRPKMSGNPGKRNGIQKRQ